MATNIVLKFGGSVLTKEKDWPEWPRTLEEAIRDAEKYVEFSKIRGLVEQLCSVEKSRNLQVVLITGAGLYGHPQVEEKLPTGVIHQVNYHTLKDVAS